ncbi:MAG: hypothetical protein VKP72_04375 [bacterium]|nr:hypothetical protein [bacterium]
MCRGGNVAKFEASAPCCLSLTASLATSSAVLTYTINKVAAAADPAFNRPDASPLATLDAAYVLAATAKVIEKVVTLVEEAPEAPPRDLFEAVEQAIEVADVAREVTKQAKDREVFRPDERVLAPLPTPEPTVPPGTLGIEFR